MDEIPGPGEFETRRGVDQRQPGVPMRTQKIATRPERLTACTTFL
jgi:hypothetical protein